MWPILLKELLPISQFPRGTRRQLQAILHSALHSGLIKQLSCDSLKNAANISESQWRLLFDLIEQVGLDFKVPPPDYNATRNAYELEHELLAEHMDIIADHDVVLPL